MILYGIKNCDTVKKACKWLNDNSITYDFFDYKKQTPSKEMLSNWIDEQGLDKIVNKRGTTYRKLDDINKNKLETKNSAIDIILENSSIIKRPIIDTGKKIIVGFDIAEYEDI